jgi:hypothetical protein
MADGMGGVALYLLCPSINCTDNDTTTSLAFATGGGVVITGDRVLPVLRRYHIRNNLLGYLATCSHYSGGCGQSPNL